MCVKHALQSLVHLLRGSLVKWYTDNQGVAAIVKSGSTKVHLHKLAMEIFFFVFCYLKNTMLALILSGFRVQRTKSQII